MEAMPPEHSFCMPLMSMSYAPNRISTVRFKWKVAKRLLGWHGLHNLLSKNACTWPAGL